MSPKVKQRGLKHKRRDAEESEAIRSFCRLGRITNGGLHELFSKLRGNPDLVKSSMITGMKC